MEETQPELRALRRRLILRDSLVFFALTLISATLFGITLFLFRSFSTHRVELAKRWYSRGIVDLNDNRPKEAVTALRTALGYSPENHDYQLMLAQALSKAGDTDEAYAYFTELWEAEPGSGKLNLELARLSAAKGVTRDAIHYYRSAIYGTWEGDGSLRRRVVRLELVRYLMAQKDFSTAQTELLIASGNSPEDPGVKLEIASLMAQSGDLTSALSLYQKVITVRPHDEVALEGAGVSAFELGHYATAQKYLLRALQSHAVGSSGRLSPSSTQKLVDSTRILALFPASDLPDAKQIARILNLRSLARNRLTACHLQLAAAGASSTALQQIDPLWKNESNRSITQRLRNNSTAQQAELDLIYKTEDAATNSCGAPTGDDALIPLIAKSQETIEQ
jgi:tetratricopeptide (TPR) repeat protein